MFSWVLFRESRRLVRALLLMLGGTVGLRGSAYLGGARNLNVMCDQGRGSE